MVDTEIVKCGISGVDEYVEDILYGRIPSCTATRQAVERFQRDLIRQDEDQNFNYHFQPKAYYHFKEFVETYVQHYEGRWAGKPFIFEPWQEFLACNLFGWLKNEKVAGRYVRRFREAHLFIPKKSGKSIFGACVAIYMLFFDGEPASQVYSLSTNRQHARKLSYRSAEIIIENNEELNSLFKCNKGIATMGISHAGSNSFYEPLSSKSSSSEGLNIHCLLNDEVSYWTDHEVYETAIKGMMQRDSPMCLNLSTANENTNSVGYEKYVYSKKLLAGAIEDDLTFALIYEIDEEDLDRWDEEEIWRKANPNYGISVRKSFFEQEIKKARHSLRTKNKFLTYNLNCWGKSTTGFVNLSEWDNSEDPYLSIEKVSHLPCVITVDLSSTTDLTCMQTTFFEGNTLSDVKFYPFSNFYLPKDRFRVIDGENSDRYKEQLTNWRDEGYIKEAGEHTINYDFIKSDILNAFRKYDVQLFSYDPFNATYFINELQKDISVDKMVEYRQGWKSMSEPMKQTGSMILNHQIIHNGNPVLKFCLSNLKAKETNGNLTPTKNSRDEKIDGAVCLIMSVGSWMGINSSDQKTKKRINPMVQALMNEEKMQSQSQ